MVSMGALQSTFWGSVLKVAREMERWTRAHEQQENFLNLLPFMEASGNNEQQQQKKKYPTNNFGC